MSPLQISILYWVLLFVYFVWHLVHSWPKDSRPGLGVFVGLIPFILFAMLGAVVFVSPFR
jgi:hypothetical protein